jgi:hydrogenase maturation protease
MRILIAGVGNIFFGDDGFGGEVARQLRLRESSAELVAPKSCRSGTEADGLVRLKGDARGRTSSTTERPDEVRVEDFGIRSYDLAYAIMDGYDAVILVDATARGSPPGTLYLIEPDSTKSTSFEVTNAHGMNPALVLQMVKVLGGEPGTLGGEPRRIYIVGCEPAVLETDEIGLSETVAAVVPQAIEMIQSLTQSLLDARTDPRTLADISGKEVVPP